MLLRARWVVPVSSDALRDGAVVVRGGRIVDVGPWTVVGSRHPGERQRDLGDAVLFPGFVNVHSHLELTILRGLVEDLPFYPWLRRLVELKNDALKADEHVFYALLGAAEQIRSGVTCVGDCSDSGAPFDALALSGLRGIVFQESFGLTQELSAASLPLLRERLDALQAMATDRVRPGISPHSPYLAGRAHLEACAGLALERGLPLSIHCAESRAEVDYLRDGSGPFGDLYRGRGMAVEAGGVGPLQHLASAGWLDLGVPVQLVHVVRAAGEDLDQLARASRARPAEAPPIGLAACPRSNARLGNGWPDLAGWSRRGLLWGLGTDGAPAVGRCDPFAEMRFAQEGTRSHDERAESPTARDVLARATLEAARSLGMADSIGSIEPGKLADLAAVSLSSTRSVPAYEPHAAVVQSGPSDVVLTMVGGEVLFDGSEVLTIDEDRVAARCRERAELITAARAGKPSIPSPRPHPPRR